MRHQLELLLIWQCLCLGPVLADNEERARTPASTVMGRGAAEEPATDASKWNEVTAQEWQAFQLAGHPVLNGTAITIVFDTAGGVSGNAGTNNYMGAYERTGLDGLMVSDLGVTKMYLDVPSGRMQQETKYLGTLRSVERFTLEDDELVLWAGGKASIHYARAP
jgi:heat shock protein HslJ